jgi:cold shock CspA family protein
VGERSRHHQSRDDGRHTCKSDLRSCAAPHRFERGHIVSTPVLRRRYGKRHRSAFPPRRINPRQDWLAIRLARRYLDLGHKSQAQEVIELCLKQNPDSKPAHLELAHILRGLNAPADRIIDHLRRSFTPGDSNFEAQFWYTRELFLTNRLADARAMFDNLNERAPGRFRNDAAAEVADSQGKLVSFQGSMARKEEGYGFVRPLDFATDLFASRGESARHEWNEIAKNGRVLFYLAFNRRGPRATNLTPRRN